MGTPRTAARTGGVPLLLLLGTLTAVGPLSLDMYLPAFPDMTEDLAATQAEVQLSLTTFLLGLALGQLVTGPLSDRWGRRWPVLIGVAAYTVCSLLCAFAPSPESLAALRLAQGVASGTGVVVARAIVRDLYSGVAAAKYFSRLILIFGVAPVAAPALGNLVLRFGSWRVTFVALAVIGALLLAAVAWWLPETLPAQRRNTAGLPGTVRAMWALLTDRIYLGYVLTQGLAFAALFAYISGSSFVIQNVFALSAGVFTLIFAVNAAAMTAVGQLNARLLDRFSTRRLLGTALLASLVAGAVLLVGAVADNLPAVVAALFVFVACVGMTLPNGLALALDRHPGHAGTAAAVLGALQLAIAAAIAPLTGLGPDDSATPMAMVVLGSTALSVLVVFTLARGRTAADPEPDRRPSPAASTVSG
ncbi:multidrug effflux MFS transporter [Plantactinospora soyae]|uniref:DHA1 family bicyclomycin/chloramphenicol resistance-like MFS transporter n=1 Tax=Plantactinospora soyae TaxID=1544732 RepID=A0A927QY90_9ACTN|nr:multidrug effflux MFS transporter [Plantactinospora soyae]MBE1488955.1 DHA1 family bicyclomycin/chloramphenicol resistance-like MFS transporter [Plantactinospora soyae]